MTDQEKPHVEVAADSNMGLVRKNNEDRYAIAVMPCGDTPSTLALVADGVGGHAAGEIASDTVVQSMLKNLAENPCADPRTAFPRAVVEASREVFQRAQSSEALRGMATTIAGAWLIGPRLYTVTVGDSRIYLRHKGRLTQANIDHTWVQEAIDLGLLSPDQAKGHPNAHVLRRHIGGANDPEPDLRMRVDAGGGPILSEMHQGLALEPGDAVVLCSDGLTDLVHPEEIEKSLRFAKLEQSVKELVDLARSRGGHDNITVVILRMPQPKSSLGRRAFPRWFWWLLGIIVVFIVFMVASAVYVLMP